MTLDIRQNIADIQQEAKKAGPVKSCRQNFALEWQNSVTGWIVMTIL